MDGVNSGLRTREAGPLDVSRKTRAGVEGITVNEMERVKHDEEQ